MKDVSGNMYVLIALFPVFIIGLTKFSEGVWGTAVA